MKTSIDRAGRMVVPKPIRDEVGLPTGGLVEVEVRDGRIEIEPVGPNIRLEKRGSRVAFVADVELPPLTVEEVRDILDRFRR